MKKIDHDIIDDSIHVPVVQAVYTKPPERTWYQKVFKFLTYRRKFMVREDYVLWISSLGCYCFIPAGFQFDGASVPKFLNNLYNPSGMLLLGSIPHDFGFRYQGLILINSLTGTLSFSAFSKRKLDTIFEELCNWESGFSKASKIAKLGLTCFGWIGWNENRKKNCNLKKDFPELFEV